jgi:thioredoxin reductase (NADPH)
MIALDEGGHVNYLIRQIEATRNIRVWYGTEVVDGYGDTALTGFALRCGRSVESVPASALFVLIGARPHTAWLPPTITRDPWGFIVTGTNLLIDGSPPPHWPLQRPPQGFETTIPGVFAVGDVRHGSTKRVASAVGEGSIVVRQVHHYLDTSTGA